MRKKSYAADILKNCTTFFAIFCRAYDGWSSQWLDQSHANVLSQALNQEGLPHDAEYYTAGYDSPYRYWWTPWLSMLRRNEVWILAQLTF